MQIQLKKHKIIEYLYAVTVLLLIGSCTPRTPWISLFDGKTLDGWEVKNGKATYRVEDGAIIGTAVSDSPNTFLCTTTHYKDFILEYDFMLDSNLNSGVQIRSNAYPEYQNGRVHGYQVEIDPSERSWTGGIYDEARRGWLHPVDSSNTEALQSFQPFKWNHIRIEAIGDTIKTWLNSVPTAHLVDDRTQSGFIGLQIHGIGNKKILAGATVHWKNIHIITDKLAAHTTATPLPVRSNNNTLTLSEKKWGWKMLWDGKTTNGWRGAKIADFPTTGWEIKDGMLTIHESGGGEAEKAGDIVTHDKFTDFELLVDFKITPGANSGIKYYVDTELNKGKGSAIGLEFQILDDERHPDAKKGSHQGSRTLASLYDLIQAKNTLPKPIGEWNTAHIISQDNHVEHWLNGRKVLEYERKSPAYRKLVSESKYAEWENFGELDEGQILLQDHGNTVSFRNIKIKVPN